MQFNLPVATWFKSCIKVVEVNVPLYYYINGLNYNGRIISRVVVVPTNGKYTIEQVASFLWKSIHTNSAYKTKVMLSISGAWKEGAFKRIRNPKTEINRDKYPFELDITDLDPDEKCLIINVNDICIIQPLGG